MSLSVVIIAKNEAHIIGKTLQSVQGITDDIVIVDSGSTDDTIAICEKYHVKVIKTTWLGYGKTKNIGIAAAKHNWILSLDADEALDQVLQSTLKSINFLNETIAYTLKFKIYFCNKRIRFGEWAGDKHIRLFNRNHIRWNDAPVHETLIIPPNISTVVLKGFVHHYTVHHVEEYIHKTISYAKLNAEKYFRQQKKATFFSLRLKSKLHFFHYYLLRLGFLDGWEGYLIAKTNAWYTFLKYTYLKEMHKNVISK